MDRRQQAHLRRAPWMKPEDCGCRTREDGSPWTVCRIVECTRPAKACGGYCDPCFARHMAEAGSGLLRLGRELDRASRHWFPVAHDRGVWRSILHYALGVGGEAGEVVDVIKKADVCEGFRDSCDLHPDGKHSLDTLAGEVGDLLTYVLALCATVGIDPEDAVAAAQEKCIARWGEVPPLPPAPANAPRKAVLDGQEPQP